MTGKSKMKKFMNDLPPNKLKLMLQLAIDEISEN